MNDPVAVGTEAHQVFEPRLVTNLHLADRHHMVVNLDAGFTSSDAIVLDRIQPASLAEQPAMFSSAVGQLAILTLMCQCITSQTDPLPTRYVSTDPPPMYPNTHLLINFSIIPIIATIKYILTAISKANPIDLLFPFSLDSREGPSTRTLRDKVTIIITLIRVTAPKPIISDSST